MDTSPTTYSPSLHMLWFGGSEKRDLQQILFQGRWTLACFKHSPDDSVIQQDVFGWLLYTRLCAEYWENNSEQDSPCPCGADGLLEEIDINQMIPYQKNETNKNKTPQLPAVNYAGITMQEK